MRGSGQSRMVERIPVVGIDVAFSGALLFGAWTDAHNRTLPAWLLSLLFLLACARIAIMGPSAETLGAPLLVGLAGCLLIPLGLMGIADVAVTAALTAFAFRQPTSFAWAVAAITAAAICGWYARRVSRSLRTSGPPRNVWDLAALLIGRWEAEPHLKRHRSTTRYQVGTRTALRYLEAMRTPDGHHLWPDPCPLVTCLAIGWFGGAASLVLVSIRP